MSTLAGSCHCGAVKFTVKSGKPEWLTSCNCSACQRFGALWLHEDASSIEIEADPDATLAYMWGDNSLTFHTCKICGCTTHWLPVDETSTRMAINACMIPKEDIADIRVRHLDGADTWQYLND